MFLKKFALIFLIIAYSILFSGCSRIINWGKITFYQGHKINRCLEIPRKFIRSIRVYDQFETLGIFNALWIDEDVIGSYVDIHAKKFELCDEEAEALFQDEVSKVDDFISFYILAYDPKGLVSPLYLPNKYENARWKVFLEVDGDGILHEPFKTKIVQLEPEFELIFGNYKSKFKIPYLVQFMAKDKCEQCLITPNTRCITLHFTSLTNKVSLVWNL